MNEEFKNFGASPSLSFGEPLEVTQDPQACAPLPQSDTSQAIDDSILSSREKQLVESFADKIDLHNVKGILEYGAGTQKKMADFSETTLSNVRSKDMGEIGSLLSNVVSEVKGFGKEEEEKGFLGFFKKSANKMTAMKAKFSRAETNIERICGSLESHQITLLKDVAVLDKMYDLNLAYYKELTMYIIAGKKKLAKERTTTLATLAAKARASGLAEDAQAARDLEELCLRFEKKLYDLDLTRTIAMQTAPQIRMIQNNDTQMAEKIQSTIVNTIPLWKNQMVIALGIQHSVQAAEAQKQVTDATNELLKKNAASLKAATIETAKATERGVVDMQTLRETNQSLISTLDEVMKIQQEGRQKRAAAEVELRSIEADLKNKLLQTHS